MDPGDRRSPEDAQDRRLRWAAEDAERTESDVPETLADRIGRLATRSGEVVGSHPDPRELDLSDAPPESAGDRDARVVDEAEIDEAEVSPPLGSVVRRCQGSRCGRSLAKAAYPTLTA